MFFDGCHHAVFEYQYTQIHKFSSNNTMHFYCNTATCFGPLHDHHQAGEQNYEKVNKHKKCTLNSNARDIKNYGN